MICPAERADRGEGYGVGKPTKTEKNMQNIEDKFELKMEGRAWKLLREYSTPTRGAAIASRILLGWCMKNLSLNFSEVFEIWEMLVIFMALAM